MSVQNIIMYKHGDAVPIYRGTPGAQLPKTTYAGGYYTDQYYAHDARIYHKPCAWFKGRLWTTTMTSWRVWQASRWNSESETWTVLTGSMTKAVTSRPTSQPLFLPYGNNCYVFYMENENVTGATNYNTVRYGYFTGEDTTLTDTGATNQWALEFDRTYSTSMQCCAFLCDAVAHKGAIYVCSEHFIVKMVPPTGVLTQVWVIPETGAAGNPEVDQGCARSFVQFNEGTTNGLLCLGADGKLLDVESAQATEIADLTDTVPNIYDGWFGSTVNADAGEVAGHGCYICNHEGSLYAFLNASGVGASASGVVMLKSTNSVDWTNVTEYLPSAISSAYHHIKGCVDPNGEHRLFFVNKTTDTGSEYTFAGAPNPYGTALSGLGGGGGYGQLGYQYFSPDAPDVESSGTYTIDGTKITFDYAIYREAIGSGVTVVPEYSTDGGATWNVATRKAGEGDNTTALGMDDVLTSPPGSGYQFVWDWATDLGVGEHNGVMFRMHGYNTEL